MAQKYSRILLHSIIGIVVFLLICFIVVRQISNAQEKAYTNCRHSVMLLTNNYANSVEISLAPHLAYAKSVADVLSATATGTTGDTLQRTNIENMIRESFFKSARYKAVYCGWETNAFDGLDVYFADSGIYRNSGRFAFSWQNFDSPERVVPNSRFFDSEYYMQPKRNLKTAVFADTADTRYTTELSVYHPIISNNSFVGVVGLSTALQFLQQETDSAVMNYPQAEILLIDDNNTIIYAHQQTDSIGKIYTIPTLDEEDKEELMPGQDIIETNDTLTVINPLNITNTNNRWHVIVRVPVETIIAKSGIDITGRSIYWLLAGVALIAILFFVLLRIAKSVTLYNNYLKKIAHGIIPSPIDIKEKQAFSETKQSLNKIIGNITAVLNQVNQLSENTEKGKFGIEKLEKQANEGVYSRISNELNNIYFNIAKPVQHFKQSFLLLADGETGKRFKGVEYTGAWKEIQQRSNIIVDAIVEIDEQIRNIKESLKNGKLQKQEKTSMVQGVFSRINNNLNATLELIETAQYETEQPLELLANGEFEEQKAEISGSITTSHQQLIRTVAQKQLAISKLIDGFWKQIENGDFSEINLQAFSLDGIYKKTAEDIAAAPLFILQKLSDVHEALNKLAIGDIAKRIDKTNLKGIWLEIVDAVNQNIKVQKEVIDATQIIAGGKLEILLEKRSDNDELISVLHEMINSLRSIFSEVNMAADNVADGSNQISESSSQVAQGAAEQAKSVDNISAAIEKMTQSIRQNTTDAQSTQQIAIKIEHDIQESQKSFSTTLEAMNEIARKIAIIDDIADRTDLLAINASIEAARAGAQGKGFAVVANEIRKLAEQSQMAAAEIEKVSRDSVKIAGNSEKLLGAMVPDIQKNASLVKGIVQTGKEQNRKIEQINHSIVQLLSVTQRNSANAEQMSTGAEQLASQAAQLSDVISFFKISENSENKTDHDAPQTQQTNCGVVISLDDDEIEDEYTKF